MKKKIPKSFDKKSIIKGKLKFIIAICLFLILLIVYSINFNRATQSNTKFEDFNHHLKDAIDMNKLQ